MHKLSLASILALLLSPAIARDVKCDRRVENGHTLQRCEFIETPQAAVPPPAPETQQPPAPAGAVAPPQHTCFATGRVGILSETATSLVIGAVDPNQPVTVLGVSPARDWVLISTLATGQRGWVDARYVTCP
jgi:Bacterial SH3 domain